LSDANVRDDFWSFKGWKWVEAHRSVFTKNPLNFAWSSKVGSTQGIEKEILNRQDAKNAKKEGKGQV